MTGMSRLRYPLRQGRPTPRWLELGNRMSGWEIAAIVGLWVIVGLALYVILPEKYGLNAWAAVLVGVPCIAVALIIKALRSRRRDAR